MIGEFKNGGRERERWDSEFHSKILKIWQFSYSLIKIK